MLRTCVVDRLLTEKYYFLYFMYPQVFRGCCL